MCVFHGFLKIVLAGYIQGKVWTNSLKICLP
uniref:Uncharacterized protein n=1 Tax=Anguilla anguilla TaxID=7936 RepID=A0A0E9SPU6_ANGAN